MILSFISSLFFYLLYFFSYIADSWHIPIRMVYYIWLVEEPKAVFPVGRPSFFCRSDPWSSCSIAVCQSRTFPPRMSLPRQNLLLHLYPLCRDSPVNMQMFCPMAQESSKLHTMKITLLSGVADPDVQRYFRFLYKISIRHSLPDSCVTFSSHCHLSFSSYYNRKELFQFTESFR